MQEILLALTGLLAAVIVTPRSGSIGGAVVLITQQGGLHQLADGGSTDVVGVEGIVGSGLLGRSDIIHTVGAEADTDSLERPVQLGFGLIVTGTIGLSEGQHQIALWAIPAVIAQMVMMGAHNEIRHAPILMVLMIDGELVGLPDHRLEDLQSGSIVGEGLDHAIVRQGHDEDIAVETGIGRGPNGDLGSEGALFDRGRNPGIGVGQDTAIVSADGAGIRNIGSIFLLRHRIGGGLDHDALVLLAGLAPYTFTDDFLGNQMLINVMNRHMNISFRV